MEEQTIDYGVIEEIETGYRQAVRIVYTTIDKIFCRQSGATNFYYKSYWEVVFRDDDPNKYNGPPFDKDYRWLSGNL